METSRITGVTSKGKEVRERHCERALSDVVHARGVGLGKDMHLYQNAVGNL